MIVKVQRSLSTQEPRQQVLIYNRTRTVQYQGDMLPELACRFRQNEHRFYAKAEVKNGTLRVLDRVADRPW